MLLMPWCHLWAEPAEDSEDEDSEEEEEVENKDPPKKLKKKLLKEPPSGESREKKLKPKGGCPGDRGVSSPAPLPLASALAGMRGLPVSHPHLCPGRRGGLRSNYPLPMQSPPSSTLPTAPTLPPPCPHHRPSRSPCPATHRLLHPARRQERPGRQSQTCQKHQEGADVHVPGERGEEGEEKQEERYGASGGVAVSSTAPQHHPEPMAPGAV